MSHKFAAAAIAFATLALACQQALADQPTEAARCVGRGDRRLAELDRESPTARASRRRPDHPVRTSRSAARHPGVTLTVATISVAGLATRPTTARSPADEVTFDGIAFHAGIVDLAMTT